MSRIPPPRQKAGHYSRREYQIRKLQWRINTGTFPAPGGALVVGWSIIKEATYLSGRLIKLLDTVFVEGVKNL